MWCKDPESAVCKPSRTLKTSRGVSLSSGKRTGEPQRNRRSRLYFHYPERLPGNGIAVGAVPEVEVAEPVPYVSVEREPELRVVSAEEGSAVVDTAALGIRPSRRIMWVISAVTCRAT